MRKFSTIRFVSAMSYGPLLFRFISNAVWHFLVLLPLGPYHTCSHVNETDTLFASFAMKFDG